MKKRSFTLIEILVVIFVIGILAGMLVPAIQHVKELNKLTTCNMRMKQTYTQINAYVGDYQRYPFSMDYYYNNDGIPWYLYMRTYFGQKFDSNNREGMLREQANLPMVKCPLADAKDAFSVNGYMFPIRTKTTKKVDNQEVDVEVITYPDTTSGSMNKPEYFTEDHDKVPMMTDAPIEKNDILHFTSLSDFPKTDNSPYYQHEDHTQLVIYADGHSIKLHNLGNSGEAKFYVHYDNSALQTTVKANAQ